MLFCDIFRTIKERKECKNMLVGTKVKEIAKKKGISLNQLEKDTKIATGSISKWDKISPSFEKVCNVAKALDVNVDELIGDGDE